MKREIKFLTTPFNHEVACYLKENGYDVYLNSKCIKTMASRDDIQMLYKIFGKENEQTNTGSNFEKSKLDVLAEFVLMEQLSRRDYSSSKMCEVINDKIEQIKNK